MAIRMRNNKNADSVCCECGLERSKVLDMFDIGIGDNIITICDMCNEDLFYKTLRAECAKNSRVKTPHDMQIIRERSRVSYKAKLQLQKEENRK